MRRGNGAGWGGPAKGCGCGPAGGDGWGGPARGASSGKPPHTFGAKAGPGRVRRSARNESRLEHRSRQSEEMMRILLRRRNGSELRRHAPHSSSGAPTQPHRGKAAPEGRHCAGRPVRTPHGRPARGRDRAAVQNCRSIRGSASQSERCPSAGWFTSAVDKGLLPVPSD